jgi:ribonuclease BN (tRNA processing enzyme)
MAGALRLDCLGSGHAFSHGRDWSGFLLNGRVLLDCPPQALAALYRISLQRIVDLDLVLLSHLHADHILGMDLLLLELEQGLASTLRENRPLAVAGPHGTYERLRAIVGESDRLPSKDDPRVAWFESDAPSSFEWAGIGVDRYVMEHDPGLVALGYRVGLEGHLVAYTGDTRLTPAIEALANNADVLVVECGGAAAAGKPTTHLNWPDVVALRARLPAETHMIVTHYDAFSAPAKVDLPAGITLAEDGGSWETPAGA